LRSQLVKTVTRLIESDEKTVLLLGDIGVFAFRDLLKKYPLRAHNIGILEQSTIGLAAGLALTGHYPIVHTIAPFLVERAYEQIKIDLGYQQLAANLISVGASYDYAGLGCTHHCPADVGILNKIPDIEIVVPGHKAEFDNLLSSNYNNSQTTYYRLSVVVVGPMLQTVLDATIDLDVTVVYCTTVKPFDVSSVLNESHKVVIVEPYYSGPILRNIEQSLGGLNGSYTCLGVPDNFIRKYGNKEDIDKLIGLDKETIRQKIINKINE